jgi:hypothetical protein
MVAVAPTTDIRGSTEIQEAIAAARPRLPIAHGARLFRAQESVSITGAPAGAFCTDSQPFLAAVLVS